MEIALMEEVIVFIIKLHEATKKIQYLNLPKRNFYDNRTSNNPSSGVYVGPYQTSVVYLFPKIVNNS